MSAGPLWAGLGARSALPPPPGTDTDFDDAQPRQRIVPATSASAFAHPFRPSSPPADDDNQAPAAPQENPMPKGQSTIPRARNLQRRICEALVDGERSRPELAALLPDLTVKQLSQALFLASGLSRIQRKATSRGDVWRLTATGTAWLQAPAGKPAEPAPRAPRKPTTAAAAPQAAAFRCAVANDGGFFLSKAGQQIDLEPAEFRQMVHYLDRMAEPTAA